MLPTPMIPADVPSGKITLRVCAFNPDRQEASSITTATYTVGEATPVPAPTLPASAAVPMGTEITVVSPSVADNFSYEVLYVLNDEDFDFTQYEYFDCVFDGDCAVIPTNMVYGSTPIVITETTTVKVITVRYKVFDGKIAGWSEPVTATYSVVAPTPAAPAFNPDGGTVAPGQKIKLTQAAGEDIYYCLNGSASLFDLKTADELGAAEDGGELILYSDGFKLEESATVLAAAVAYNDAGYLSWSEVISKAFTVEGEPLTVAIPVITPGNDAQVHIGDLVTITCATDGAEIYYTTDGTSPFEEDKDGYPVAVKTGAKKYTAPFALTEAMLIKQGQVYALKISAVAAMDDMISENGASAGYNVYPNAPEFTPTAGIMGKGEKVTLKSVPAFAKIYYTTDGKTPTEEEATEYTAPIEINEAVTIKAIAVLGQYETPAEAAYTIGIGGKLELEPARGYVKPGQELDCTVPRAVLEEYGQVFVLYVENDADAVLESDVETLMKIADTKPGLQGDARAAADVDVPYKLAVVVYDEAKKETEWVRPIVISEDASDEVKFRARMAVVVTGEDDGEATTLIYSRELTTTYYTVVPAPVFEPGHGLVTAGQELGCTVPETYDWEQGNGVAVLIYIENNDDFKLDEVPAKEIAEQLFQDTDVDPDQPAGPAPAYKLAVCTQDFDDDAPVYEWQMPVVIPDDADGTVSLRARLVMLTQNHEAEFEAAFSSEVKASYYTALPAPRFVDAGEVLQSDALNVEFPAAIDFAYYLDQAFILYVENNAEAVLAYNGTMGELQALAQGGSPATPDDPEEEEGGLQALSAKAGLPYKVAVYDAEYASWNPAVYLTTMGAVNVRARLAVGTGWDGSLIYSDEFTAAYTVKERPRNNKPAFTVDGKEVAGATAAVKKGAAIGFKSGYEGNDDYIVCYVVNGKDEDFANATMAEMTMGTSPVKMFDPDFTKLTVQEAQTIKAATVQELASGDLWWSDIVTVAFTILPDPVAKPTFSVEAGEVAKGTAVEIACETEGATIYYTVDGSEPTEKSTEYKEAIVINAAMTLKAIAVKGEGKSEVATAAYTVKTANEDLELAGVSVYPNPSNGLFNIELPVAATIEVFASNGVLCQRVKAVAGVATLNIDRGGIYFLRITGEGRTTVKRVIVR
ncbi:MAG: chitobiase/beta-hexosaminidase C-terminal domain-containing protein [Bacteroidales bacterium]|nr:chitobiase/beta-hexosaminidase C-terminal domain-containing protein [Bacteroidales bacterium]